MRVFLRNLLLFFACCTSVVLAGCTQDNGARGPVVLAASSLQEALEEISQTWVEQGHRAPQLSFASSAALARQIASGAPADVFVSADQEWTDYLTQKGLVTANGAVPIASNRLVIVGPASTNATETVAQALGRLNGGRLAMGEPDSVPAGRYGKAALAHLGLWDGVAAAVVPAENVRAALVLVERGEAALGIVYASDVQASKAVTARAVFPADSHPAIVYPAVKIAASTHADADAFLAFLSSPAARAILQRHGFGPPPA